MNSVYYKRDGNQTSDLSEALRDKRVAQDFLAEGFCVSTVHLGIDHRFGEGPSLIFETMVFRQENGKVTSFSDLYCDRYSTEAEAAAGHARVVAQIKAGTLAMYGIDEESET